MKEQWYGIVFLGSRCSWLNISCLGSCKEAASKFFPLEGEMFLLQEVGLVRQLHWLRIYSFKKRRKTSSSFCSVSLMNSSSVSGGCTLCDCEANISRRLKLSALSLMNPEVAVTCHLFSDCFVDLRLNKATHIYAHTRIRTRWPCMEL